MQLPLVQDVPIVRSFARNFKAVFPNHAQYEHFKDYLSGLIVLENKTLANIARCTLACCDKSNLSRFFSHEQWAALQLNQTRSVWALKKTKAQRKAAEESYVAIDDTLCEHVGSLFEYIDIHYNHAQQRYSRAHNPVTSHYVSGKVRFPVDFGLYRRYDEFTQWESFVHKHFPHIEIPKGSKARNRLKRQLEKALLEDPEFKERHEAFQSKIDFFEETTMQVQEVVPHLPKSSFKEIKIKDKSYWCFSISVTLNTLGRVRIVVSYDNQALSGTYALLVTNRTDWESKKILSTYLQRWPIETFYRDGKQHLGFDKYQLMSRPSIEKHWSCVFTAYTMLHLEVLGLSSAKQSERSIQSIGDACRYQAEEAIKALVQWTQRRSEKGGSMDELLDILFAKQYKPCLN